MTLKLIAHFLKNRYYQDLLNKKENVNKPIIIEAIYSTKEVHDGPDGMCEPCLDSNSNRPILQNKTK
jgi:hypothetical protein